MYETPHGPSNSERQDFIDKCPACGTWIQPGVQARHCKDCNKAICSSCKMKYNKTICLCKDCFQNRKANEA